MEIAMTNKSGGHPDGTNHAGIPANMVSSFDLEPNPFEQSFATTKKAHSSKNHNPEQTGARPADEQNMTGSMNTGVLHAFPPSKSTLEYPQSAQTSSTSAHPNVASHGHNFDHTTTTAVNPASSKPELHMDHGKPAELSTRLPPLLLSDPARSSSSMIGQQHTRSPGSSHMLSNQTHQHYQLPPAQNSHFSPLPQNLMPPGTTTPGFFLNLSKTGLTPNSSGMRPGLTPGNISATDPIHSQLQAQANIHAQNQGKLPPHPSPSLQSPANIVPPLSLPAEQFTPGLSSLLGISLQQQPQQQPPPQPQQPQQQRFSPQIAMQPSHWGPLSSHLSGNSTAVNSNSSTSSNSLCVIPSGSNKKTSSSVPSGRASSDSQSSTNMTRISSTGNTAVPTESIGATSVSPPLSKEPPTKRQKNRSNSKLPKTSIDTSFSRAKDEQDRKRKEFLERNRVAASKFRKRKKQYIKKVEGDLKFYETEYDDLGQCMDKLCGISKNTINSSLVGMLKQALLQDDMKSSLTLCSHIEQVLLQTQYVQRGGGNPIREEEERRRLENPDGDNSDYEFTRRPSMAAGSSDGYHHAQGQDQQDPEITNRQGLVPDQATGTINNLPLIINGNTLLSLEDVQKSSEKQNGVDNVDPRVKVEAGLPSNIIG
ncbi:LAFA_0F06084g1_1 [Lachancea sp. 'fantastica']|nr:LAFA_0F06084g1_1 [Lachancea sp. 'fantastica']